MRKYYMERDLRWNDNAQFARILPVERLSMKAKQPQRKAGNSLEMTIAAVALLLMILETLISTRGVGSFFR